jgi:hypothetical protein
MEVSGFIVIRYKAISGVLEGSLFALIDSGDAASHWRLFFGHLVCLDK